MKLLLVNEEPSAHLYARALAVRLLQRGHQVFLTSPLPWEGPGEHPPVVTGMEALAGFGLVEIVSSIGGHVGKLRRILDFLRRERPERTVLIDYGGFNMILGRLAGSLTTLDWFIPPKVWAWGKWRTRVIARLCRRVHCLFPFEVDIWRRAGAEACFHGHPLLELLPEGSDNRQENLVCLLPGSRKSELAFSVPVLTVVIRELSQRITDLEFAVLAADGVPDETLTPLTDAGARIVRGTERMPLLSVARAAAAVSGTVVLEAALVGTPVVACYSLNPFSLLFARRVLKIGRVTLPNILLGMDVIPEIIQEEINPSTVTRELERLLTDEARNLWVKTQFARLRQILGGDQDAMVQLADCLLAEHGVAA